MATYNKFEGFVGYLGTKVIDCNADTFNLYLSNAVPSASADNVKADLAEITNENGYTAPVDVQNTYAEASGVGTCTAVDVVVNATGSVGPFQYAVTYDDTVASPVVDPLIAWYDYGSALTLANGESFTVDFTTLFTLT
jgi:hypothetical protein